MNFLIFLWNLFAKFIWFASFIVFEIIVFSIIVKAFTSAGMPIMASFLTLIFIVWIVVEIFIRIFIGGSKSLIRWLFRF